MNFQNLINPLGFMFLDELIITIVVAIGSLILNKIHMNTVSWNG